MKGDVAPMEDGGKSDFNYGKDWRVMGWPPAKVDQILRNSDVIRLGAVAIMVLGMPGHTRGRLALLRPDIWLGSHGERFEVSERITQAKGRQFALRGQAFLASGPELSIGSTPF
ncbi:MULTISPECIES: hypothetical protein [unclassified Novosphingobium]|uniref:hypothetical protein n=1 Tax=unclassified Novosphingobium TaxID=2644732 RepID=UPI00135AA8A1|nr:MULTISPECIES: hypothetical protein [unclassified Novosphingobium]